MSTSTTSISSTALSKQFSTTQTVTTTGGVIRDPTLGAAKVGELTTRTDNNTGILTMAAGHGITTAARLDVYWTNTDGTQGYRYGMVVGTVSGNTVPIDLGGGDNLPLVNTAITAMVPQEEEFTIAAADLEFLGARAPDPSLFVFADSGNVAVKVCLVESLTNAYQWNSLMEASNPLGSTDITKVFLSRGTATRTGQLVAVGLDNDA